ncbi:MAG: peptidoglycan-binding domain-containing protein [Syntrophomonas sp.]|nr:peptidoglycan-binding domain-containing protein [Syntrophomonas sp.]
MLKKIWGILLFAYLLIMVGGCVSSKNVGLEQPQVTIDPAINKPLENVDQLTEAEQKSASEGGGAKGVANKTSASSSGGTQGVNLNQSGIKNYGADNGDGLPAVIQLLTEEDLQMALNQLVKLGYLSGTKVTENDFNAALTQFQNAQKLRPSGVLDRETLNSLNSPVELVGPK